MIVQFFRAPKKVSGWLICADDGRPFEWLDNPSEPPAVLDVLAPRMRDLGTGGRWIALPPVRVSGRELARLRAMTAKGARR